MARRVKRRGAGRVGSSGCLIVLLVFAGGLAGAAYGGAYLGQFGLPMSWLGAIVGFVVGAVVSFGLLYGLTLLGVVCESLLCGGIPYLPTCRNGKCKSGLLTDFGDYEPEQVGGHWGYFRCRCGLLYWRKREEGRILEVLPDGTTKPYMVWRPFRGWRPDRDLPTKEEP